MAGISRHLAKMFMNNVARIAKNILNKLESKSLSTAIHSESLVNQKGKCTCGCDYNKPNSEKCTDYILLWTARLVWGRKSGAKKNLII